MDTKQCRRCQQIKPFDDFHWRNKSKGTKFIWCKLCRKAYDHRRQTTSQYREQKRIRNLEVRKRNRKILYNHFLQNPCECGEDRIPCLQFDHIGDATKISDIADMMSYSVKSLLAEIAKCVVRCANCHAMVTAEEQGWYSQIQSERLDLNQRTS